MIQYDAIVVGGGINSLAVAALLAQENKSILLLESRDALGGLSSTHEFTSGFKCNMVYDYIRWIDPRLIKLLNLQNYDLELLYDLELIHDLELILLFLQLSSYLLYLRILVVRILLLRLHLELSKCIYLQDIYFY